jgi:hypothetical protein
LPNQKPRINHGWIWFFIVLAVLAMAAVFIQVWYNPTVPLTASLLSEAQTRWKERGPRNYDMDYTIKTLDNTAQVQVHVRNGKAVWATMNGVALESRLYHYHTMPALLAFIEEFREQDAQPGRPRTYTNVLFDPVDGHLIHYVRSVALKRERQEIIVQRIRVTKE